MELSQKSRKVAQYKKEGNFAEAIRFFKTEIHKHYPVAEIANDVWLVANIIHCLRKTNDYVAALRLPVYLKTEPAQWPAPVISECGWSLYYLIKASLENNSTETCREWIPTAVFILETPENSFTNLLKVKLLFELAKLEMKSPDTRYERIADWCDKITTSMLSKEAGKNDKGKTIMTDFEQWGLLYSKVLYKAGRYDACLSFCDELIRYHPNAIAPGRQIWLHRRKGLALLATGNATQALDNLQKALSQKLAWYIAHETGQACQQTGQTHLALAYFCFAALLPGEPKNKVRLFGDLAQLCHQTQSLSAARWHAAKAMEIRRQNSWPVPAQLSDIAGSGAVDVPRNKEFATLWKTIMRERGLLQDGSITKIMNQGHRGDGFLKADDGRNIYFKNAVADNTNLLATGSAVQFIAHKTEHKGRPAWLAIYITNPPVS